MKLENTEVVIPQPAMALFVMFARSLFWQRFPSLHSWISYRLIINSRRILPCKRGKKNILFFVHCEGAANIIYMPTLQHCASFQQQCDVTESQLRAFCC